MDVRLKQKELKYLQRKYEKWKWSDDYFVEEVRGQVEHLTSVLLTKINYVPTLIVSEQRIIIEQLDFALRNNNRKGIFEIENFNSNDESN